MRYIVEIDTENDAFQADVSSELQYILRTLANRIQSEPWIATRFLWDSNSNKVGTARLED